jgi:hypothetical protein
MARSTKGDFWREYTVRGFLRGNSLIEQKKGTV